MKYVVQLKPQVLHKDAISFGWDMVFSGIARYLCIEKFKHFIWNIIFSILFVTLLVNLARTQNLIISGTYAVSSQESWNYDTVFVAGDIVITNTGKLTILSGTHIRFMGYYGIQVNGSLHIKGMESDTVYLEYWNSGLYNIDLSDTIGGWRGIYGRNFSSTTDSIIVKYSKITHCKKWENDTSLFNRGGAFTVKNYPFIGINNSVISNCAAIAGSAIWCDSSRIQLDSNIFSNNSNRTLATVNIHKTSTTLYGNTFVWNRYNAITGSPIPSNSTGVVSIDYPLNPFDTAIIDRNFFSNNEGFYSGISISHKNLIVRNNILVNNQGHAISTICEVQGYILNNLVLGNGYYGIYATTIGGGSTGIYNCIAHSNFQEWLPTDAYDIWGSNIGPPFIYPDVFYSDFPDPTFDATGNSFDNAAGNFLNPPPSFDYLLIDGLDYDYRMDNLYFGRNKGAPDSLNLPVGILDFWGNNRKIGERVDVGPFESNDNTSLNDIIDANIKVFPNPTTGQIFFSSNVPIHKIELIDNSGKVYDLPNSSFSLMDLSSLNSGIYYLNFNYKSKNVVQKIIKQ